MFLYFTLGMLYFQPKIENISLVYAISDIPYAIKIFSMSYKKEITKWKENKTNSRIDIDGKNKT